MNLCACTCTSAADFLRMDMAIFAKMAIFLTDQ